MPAVAENTIMAFPCQFPIKVMGIAGEGFEALVWDIVGRHTPDLSADVVRNRLSQTGKYIAVTVTINARSRRQLDRIYLDLTTHERVIMAL